MSISEAVAGQLQVQNYHWEKPFQVPKYHREIFNKLLENMSNHFVISVMGPRRVGKTTILKQLINHLVNEGMNEKNILYFSLDIYNTDLLTIFNAFRYEFGHPMDGRYLLIFDEIQYLNNWASHVKLLKDSLPNCKIIISGSSATELQRGRESLAGREIEMFLPPLSFQEYLKIKQINPISETKIWEEYVQYMDHQLPDLINNDISAKNYIVQLVNKIINIDIAKIHGIKDTIIIDTIFRIICKSPGEIIIVKNLANDLGINRRTAQKYLEYLEHSLLIRKLYNHSRNPRKSENRNKRYYPFFTSLHWYVHPYRVDFGKKAETEVAFQLQAEYFFNERGQEIDFIINEQPNGELNTGVEVKMRNSITAKQIRTLINSKIINKRALIIKHNSKVDNRIKDHVKIIKLPYVTQLINNTL